MQAFREIGPVSFPAFAGHNVNMMPIVHGDPATVPAALHGYADMLAQCDFEPGSTVYLTVHEGVVPRGGTLRRPGLHTDATRSVGWGAWGRREGIYMASTDGSCRVFDCMTADVDEHGALAAEPDAPDQVMSPATLYWMTDRTPHESLPSEGPRQFFRLVSSEIGVWFAQHSTPNPLGVQPAAPISQRDKFAPN